MRINKNNILISIIIGLVIGSYVGYFEDDEFSARLYRSNIINSRFELVLYYSFFGIVLGAIIGLFFNKKEFSIKFSGIVGVIILFIFSYIIGALIEGSILWCTNLHEIMKCSGLVNFTFSMITTLIFSITGFIIGLIVGVIFKFSKKFISKRIAS